MSVHRGLPGVPPSLERKSRSNVDQRRAQERETHLGGHLGRHHFLAQRMLQSSPSTCKRRIAEVQIGYRFEGRPREHRKARASCAATKKGFTLHLLCRARPCRDSRPTQQRSHVPHSCTTSPPM